MQATLRALWRATRHAAARPTPRRRGQTTALRFCWWTFFCGLCGFTTGAAAAGMRPTLAIDTDAHALHYHRINHPTAKHAQLRLGPQSDDRLAELIRAHVPAGRAWHLHGSPPCQLFS